MLKEIITSIVDRVCGTENYSYNKIFIKNQRTRLGSCSSKKNLNFNWQITKFPKEVLEYVIKHEIVHLKHQNHKKEFWSEVQRLEPNFKKYHKWVKLNAHKLVKF